MKLLVFKLFGRASSTPQYALRDEDMLEWLHALLTETARLPEWLGYQLKENPLLFIGCQIPDWVGRFLVRMASSTRLSLSSKQFFIVGSSVSQASSLFEFFTRYITRPAIANERLKRNRAGQVVLQLKSPYKDGTTHIVMKPLEFMERLAALVPRPRLHLIRFHGVLAPNAKLRSQILPAAAERVPETSSEHAHAQGAQPRIGWARLLKQVFDIDIEHCCGGSLKSIAAPSAGS